MKSCLIFVHIPKTAGQTLSRVLRRQYKRSHTINLTMLDQPLDDFEKIPYETRINARLVQGHMHYGLHRLLPQRSEYITVLRHPINRALSLYAYILREPKHPLHDRLVASGMNLKEFIESGIDKNQVDNGQTRQIAGVQEGDPTRADVERAKENLRGFLVVGLTERFDESLILMKRKLDWRTPFYVSRNVSQGKTISQASERALELIRERNELDLELYKEAHRIFDGLVAEQDESFKGEVARFKRLNRFSDVVDSRFNALLDRVRHSRLANRLRGI